MLLDRDEMQPLAALRVVAPRLPGRKEIEPETESGLEDRERCAFLASANGSPFRQRKTWRACAGPPSALW
jgi:hypothetical protein